MRILMVGGGSGGHVTPVAAVCKEVRKLQPKAELRVWCDKGFYQQAFATMVAVDGHIRVESIVSGKLRRYHGHSLFSQLRQVRSIVIPNLIDSTRLIAGTLQSVGKLLVWRPDVIFSKGGFVCLPVGVAALILRIPLVIHDSDAHPGLTSRILSRWARTIATGAPLKFYSYPKDRSHYIGIPVSSTAKPYGVAKQQRVKKELGFDVHEPLVVVTGGGLGATTMNNAVIASLDGLLGLSSVALVAGKANVEGLKSKAGKRKGLRIEGYITSDDMQKLLGAADIVVSRAGATTLLELAALAKPSIIVPNAHLTGGHQIKNAQVYHKARAIVLLEDASLQSNPAQLTQTISALLLRPERMKQLSKNIHDFAKPEAAKDMARLIIEAAL